MVSNTVCVCVSVCVCVCVCVCVRACVCACYSFLTSSQCWLSQHFNCRRSIFAPGHHSLPSSEYAFMHLFLLLSLLFHILPFSYSGPDNPTDTSDIYSEYLSTHLQDRCPLSTKGAVRHNRVGSKVMLLHIIVYNL